MFSLDFTSNGKAVITFNKVTVVNINIWHLTLVHCAIVRWDWNEFQFQGITALMKQSYSCNILIMQIIYMKINTRSTFRYNSDSLLIHTPSGEFPWLKANPLHSPIFGPLMMSVPPSLKLPWSHGVKQQPTFPHTLVMTDPNTVMPHCEHCAVRNVRESIVSLGSSGKTWRPQQASKNTTATKKERCHFMLTRRAQRQNLTETLWCGETLHAQLKNLLCFVVIIQKATVIR